MGFIHHPNGGWEWDHQTFQVPKIQVLNLIRLYWGWVFPYISRIHTAYIGVSDSSILGTFPKCLVMGFRTNHQQYFKGLLRVLALNACRKVGMALKPCEKNGGLSVINL